MTLSCYQNIISFHIKLISYLISNFMPRIYITVIVFMVAYYILFHLLLHFRGLTFHVISAVDVNCLMSFLTYISIVFTPTDAKWFRRRWRLYDYQILSLRPSWLIYLFSIFARHSSLVLHIKQEFSAIAWYLYLHTSWNSVIYTDIYACIDCHIWFHIFAPIIVMVSWHLNQRYQLINFWSFYFILYFSFTSTAPYFGKPSYKRHILSNHYSLCYYNISSHDALTVHWRFMSPTAIPPAGH